MPPPSRSPRALALLALLATPALAIVNGSSPDNARYLREYPWAVALHYPGSAGICSAQLIAPQWVLTAAHCASANALVMSGHVDRTRASATKVVEVIRHPAYDDKTGANDVGLLRLETPLAITPVPMLTKAEAPALLREGVRAVIAGYGHRSPNSGFSTTLVVSDVELRSLQFETTRFVFVDRASGPCGGDSGGPMLVERPDGTWALAGVASRVVGNLCAQGGGISLYMNVAELRGFIDRYVR